MLLRRAPGFVAALILLPLTILAPSLRGYTAMVCRMTGAVTLADCAPAPQLADRAALPSPDGQGASDAGRWLDESCCDFVRVTFAQPPVETATTFEHRSRLVASLPAIGVVSPAVWAAPPIAEGVPAPPGLGPPRRLVTQIFLL